MYENLIAGIDAEISRLSAVRKILSDVNPSAAEGILKPKRGRPKKTVAAVAKSAKSVVNKKRVLSPEARAKIAAAQKARWAAAKKS
jgi:hypothetical protein